MLRKMLLGVVSLAMLSGCVYVQPTGDNQNNMIYQPHKTIADPSLERSIKIGRIEGFSISALTPITGSGSVFGRSSIELALAHSLTNIRALAYEPENRQYQMDLRFISGDFYIENGQAHREMVFEYSIAKIKGYKKLIYRDRIKSEAVLICKDNCKLTDRATLLRVTTERAVRNNFKIMIDKLTR